MFSLSLRESKLVNTILMQEAFAKLFQLRAAIHSERARVAKSADCVEWNALSIFTEQSESLHQLLIQVLDDAASKIDADEAA